MLTGSGAVDFEEVAALEPDLVVATPWNVKEKADFDRLASISNTVVIPEGANYTWDQMVQYLGEVFNKAESASSVVAKVDQMYSQKSKELRIPDNSTYTFVKYSQGKFTFGGGGYFKLFGLTPSKFGDGKTSYDSSISKENTQELDADLIVILGAGEPLDSLRNDESFGEIPAMSQNVVYYQDQTENPDLGVAINSPDPQSLKWALDEISPALAGLGV